MTPPIAPAADDRTARRALFAAVVISLGVSLIVVDATIVGVLLPQLVDDLGLSTASAEWVTSVYALVFAALLIPFGRAGDLFGRRRMIVLGVAVFTVASVLAALSTDSTSLIGARALQGVGASMVMPATLSTLNAMFTGKERAHAFGIWGATIAGMSALGPLVGGALASGGTWRWAFGVNLVFGAALIWGVLKVVPETRAATAGGRLGIDWPGALLSAAAFGLLVCGIIEGPAFGWWTATRHVAAGGLSPIPLMIAAGLALLVVLVLVERARAAAGRPVMLDLTLFSVPSFRNGNLASALINVGELGLLFVLPLFLLGVHGSAPLEISLAILPLAAGAFGSGAVAHVLANKYGPHRVVQGGMVLEVLAVLALAATLSPTTGGLGLAPWMLLYGLGLGLTSAQLTNVSLADVPPDRAGQASGTQSTARQIGAALGVAVIGTVFATTLGHAMSGRLDHEGLPAARRDAITRDLRHSAGTSARDLHRTPGMGEVARAADASLADASRAGALATAVILAGGLLLSLRLRPSGASRSSRVESDVESADAADSAAVDAAPDTSSDAAGQGPSAGRAGTAAPEH
ncbi:MFS transporter [Actinomadura harenae]|uniref:MFS transporter n=2 Tax=Actinomadura harenae TaxID=2483351 RepID=A0A3M2LT71_9ACTN|nr:MFS transporter [Actinomadura harenae]